METNLYVCEPDGSAVWRPETVWLSGRLELKVDLIGLVVLWISCGDGLTVYRGKRRYRSVLLMSCLL
jgi:hypothetical protein